MRELTQEEINRLTAFSRKIAARHAFGYFSKEDVVQECLMLALEALPRYDGKRNLLNFLYTHISHRFKNVLRNKKERINPPCPACAAGNFCKGESQPCRRHKIWIKTNADKRSIVSPDYLPEELSGKTTKSPADYLSEAELRAKLDNELTGEARHLWLMFTDGVKLTKADTSFLKKAVADLLGSEA